MNSIGITSEWTCIRLPCKGYCVFHHEFLFFGRGNTNFHLLSNSLFMPSVSVYVTMAMTAGTPASFPMSNHTRERVTVAKLTLENFYSNLILQHEERETRYCAEFKKNIFKMLTHTCAQCSYLLTMHTTLAGK